MFWYCVIFLGLLFLAMVFFLEETKYTKPVIIASPPIQQQVVADITKSTNDTKFDVSEQSTQILMGENLSNDWIDHSIPMKNRKERFQLITETPGTLDQFIKQMFRPFIYLYAIPAVAYTAIEYGSLLSLFSVIANSEAAIFGAPPYNFGTIGIGLIAIPALIGGIVGSIYGGIVSDWAILYLSKRNNGIYEPEFRLYMCILPAFVGPAGIFLYGVAAVKVFIPPNSWVSGV